MLGSLLPVWDVMDMCCRADTFHITTRGPANSDAHVHLRASVTSEKRQSRFGIRVRKFAKEQICVSDSQFQSFSSMPYAYA